MEINIYKEFKRYHINSLFDVFYNAPSIEDFKKALGISEGDIHRLISLGEIKTLRVKYDEMIKDEANRRKLLSIVYKDNICSTIAHFCFTGTDDNESVWIDFTEEEED